MSPHRTIFLLAVSLVGTAISETFKVMTLDKCINQYGPMLKGDEVKLSGNDFTCKSKEWKIRFKETSSSSLTEADSFVCKQSMESDGFYFYAVSKGKTHGLTKEHGSQITCVDAGWKLMHTIIVCVIGGLFLLCCCGGCIIFCIRQKKAAAAVAAAGTPAGPPGAYPQQQPSSGPPPPSASPSA